MKENNTNLTNSAQPHPAHTEKLVPAAQYTPNSAGVNQMLPAENQQIPPELRRYRTTIDNLDAALVHILAERFRCTKQVGELKARLVLPASDPAREAQQIQRLRRLAEESGLDPVFAEKFLKFIVAEVIQHHADIAAKVQQAQQ